MEAPPQLRKTFSIGAKVRVSKKGGWQRDAFAVVIAGPEPVTTRQGEDYYWWVEFVEPERDAEDDGPYHQAQILSRYIADAT